MNRHIIGIANKKMADRFNFATWKLYPDARKIGLPKGNPLILRNGVLREWKRTLGIMKYKGKQAYVDALESMIKWTED